MENSKLTSKQLTLISVGMGRTCFGKKHLDIKHSSISSTEWLNIFGHSFAKQRQELLPVSHAANIPEELIELKSPM